MNRKQDRAASPEPSPPNSGTSFSRLLQPAGELLRRDHAAVAVLLLPSGFLAPGVERALGQLACIDAGETLFVLPAVFLEHLVALLALRPCVDSPHLPAGAALAVADPAAVLRAGLARHGEVAQAVLAYPHPHLTLHALPHMEIDEVVNVPGIEHLGKNLVVDDLKAHGLGVEPKGVQRVAALGVVVGHHLLGYGFLLTVHVQRLCDQSLDLLLHGVDAAAEMGNLLVWQQVLKISGRGAVHHIQTLQPVQPQQLKADMPGRQFIQAGHYGLQFVVVPGLIKRQQRPVHLPGDGLQLPDIHIQQTHQTFRKRKVFFYGPRSVRCIGVLVVLPAAAARMLRAKCRHEPAKGERTNGARARRTAEKKHRG